MNVKPLNLNDITSFNDSLKNQLFSFASAKLEYDTMYSNGFIKPLLACLAVIAVVILDNLAFPAGKQGNGNIQAVSGIFEPWIIKVGFCLLLALLVTNIIRYKPYRLRERKRIISEMSDFFINSYGIDVNTVKADDLWVEVIKQSEEVEKIFVDEGQL